MARQFIFTALVALALGLVAGCAGPRSDAAVLATAAPSKPVAVAPPARSGPLNLSSKPGDLACKSDADCVVKDVGSCCGYRPQCLNKEAKTFPERVKARCAREGRVSTCGMLAVTGCECVQGKCAAQLQSDNSSLVR